MYVCLQQKTSERRSKRGAALVLNEKLWCGVNTEKLPADLHRACVVSMGGKLPGTLYGYRELSHEPLGWAEINDSHACLPRHTNFREHQTYSMTNNISKTWSEIRAFW